MMSSLSGHEAAISSNQVQSSGQSRQLDNSLAAVQGLERSIKPFSVVLREEDELLVDQDLTTAQDHLALKLEESSLQDLEAFFSKLLDQVANKALSDKLATFGNEVFSRVANLASQINGMQKLASLTQKEAFD